MSDSDADDSGNLIDVEDAGYDEFLLDTSDEDESKPPSRRASRRQSVPVVEEPVEPAGDKSEAAADSSAKRKTGASDASDASEDAEDDGGNEEDGGRRRGKFVSERSESKAPAKRARFEPADRPQPPSSDRGGRGRGSGARVDTTTVPLQLPPALPALGAAPGGLAPPSRTSRPPAVQQRDGAVSDGRGSGSGRAPRPTVRRDGPGSGSRGGSGLLLSPPNNGGLARPPNMPMMGGGPRGFVPPAGYGTRGRGGFGPGGPVRGPMGGGYGGPGRRGPPMGMGGVYGAGAPMPMGSRPSPAPIGNRPSPAPGGRQRVKIANLSAATKGKMLLDHLETIAAVTKMTKKGTVADVEFESKEMALKAKRQLDRSIFDGSRISMTLA